MLLRSEQMLLRSKHVEKKSYLEVLVRTSTTECKYAKIVLIPNDRESIQKTVTHCIC